MPLKAGFVRTYNKVPRSFPAGVRRHIRDATVTGQSGEKRRSRYKLLHARRASIAVMIAIMFPLLLGFGVLGIELSHGGFQEILLQQTVRAAALAGANRLTTYYTSSPNSTATLVAAAQTIAAANMPASKYGNVVLASNVVIGTWNTTNATFTSGGTSPNAVQVTGLSTAANGNPVQLFFGNIIGYKSYDLTAKAVASYGTGQTFNTIIINDLSGSFTSNISAQQAADTAILSCIATASGASSKFGITTINGHSFTYEPLTQASTNTTAIQSKIKALTSCSVSGYCNTGSNVASGIYSAIQQFSGSGYTNAHNSVIIITDGVPNVPSNGMTYAKADGIGPTLNTSPTTPIICTTKCTDANLLTMAKNQAAAARAASISISTIYYTGDTSASSSACVAAGLASSCTSAQLQAAYAASLAALSGGTGISLVAPTAGQISSSFAAFCATMASSVKSSL